MVYGLPKTSKEIDQAFELSEEKCCCGEPQTLGVVHRKGDPCYIPDKPPSEKCELPRKIKEYFEHPAENMLKASLNALIDYLAKKEGSV
jgi:hypothetical protein